MEHVTSYLDPHLFNRFLTLEEVEKKIGFKKSWIYAEKKKGKFPKGIKIGGHRLWLQSEIEAWMVEQINNNRAKEEEK